MDRWKTVRSGFIESREIPLYVLRKTGVRITVRQARGWLRNGAILRMYPRYYKVTSDMYMFTTEKQIDKFLKRMGNATKFKRSLTGYKKLLFDKARKRLSKL